VEVAASTPPLPPTTTNLPHINRMTGCIYIGVQYLAAPAHLGTTIMPPNWMVTGFRTGKLQEDTGYCTLLSSKIMYGNLRHQAGYWT